MKRNIIKQCFEDDDGKIVVGQFPNIPLWGWIVFTLLSNMLATGQYQTASRTMAQLFLFTWCYLEIRTGSNLFRRLLGIVVLAFIVRSVLLP